MYQVILIVMITKYQLLNIFECKIGVACYFVDNQLPKTFTQVITLLKREEQNIFFKYQDQLNVWYNGYDHEVAKELIEEIKGGLL
jgi:hypothetical protein